MLVCSILSLTVAFVLAFTALTDEQQLSYVGLTKKGFPFPYICKKLTPKLVVKFDTLPEKEKRKWAFRIFKVVPASAYVDGTTHDFINAVAECIGFSATDDAKGVYDVYEKLSDKKKKQIQTRRKEYGKRAREEIQAWRLKKGLAPLKVIHNVGQ